MNVLFKLNDLSKEDKIALTVYDLDVVAIDQFTARKNQEVKFKRLCIVYKDVAYYTVLECEIDVRFY